MRDLYDDTQEGTRLSLEDLVTTIKLLNLREIFIVMDSLDEYSGSVDDLLEMISKLSARSRCKLFLTSRPESRFEEFFVHFKSSFQLSCTVDDSALVQFITTKIDENLEVGFLINEELKGEIIIEIEQKARGSYVDQSFSCP